MENHYSVNYVVNGDINQNIMIRIIIRKIAMMSQLKMMLHIQIAPYH